MSGFSLPHGAKYKRKGAKVRTLSGTVNIAQTVSGLFGTLDLLGR